MKNCEEMYNDLLKRRDEYLKNKTNNRKFAIRISLTTLALIVCSILAVSMINKDFFSSKKSNKQTTGNSSTISNSAQENNEIEHSEEFVTSDNKSSSSAAVKEPVSNSDVKENDKTATTSTTTTTSATEQNGNNSTQNKWPEKVIEYGDDATSTEMTTKITPWDELSITGKYNEIEFNGDRYSTKNQTIDSELLLENLGSYKAIGLDEINDKLYETQVTAYSIKNLSKNAVIAINFESTSEFYVATNPFYSPATLGDFITDLNLKENLTFGLVRYDNSRGMGDDYVQETIELTDLKAEMVWEKLLDNPALKNVYSIEDWWHFDKMNISVNLQLLGYRNFSFGVTEDGYITTNILDTGKAFYIGPQKAKEFMDYLLETCNGYKIVYKNSQEDNDSQNNETTSASTSSVTASHTVKNQNH